MALAGDAISKGESTFGGKGSMILSESGEGGYYNGADLLNGLYGYRNGIPGFEGHEIIEYDGKNPKSITLSYTFNDRLDSNNKYISDRMAWAYIKLIACGKGEDYNFSVSGTVTLYYYGYRQ